MPSHLSPHNCKGAIDFGLIFVQKSVCDLCDYKFSCKQPLKKMKIDLKYMEKKNVNYHKFYHNEFNACNRET